MTLPQSHSSEHRRRDGNWAFGLHLVPSESPEDLLLSWVVELVVFSQGPYLGGWGLVGWGGVCFEFSDLKRFPMAILSSATSLQLGTLRPGLPWVPLPCCWPLLLSPEKRLRKEVGDPRGFGPQP